MATQVKEFDEFLSHPNQKTITNKHLVSACLVTERLAGWNLHESSKRVNTFIGPTAFIVPTGTSMQKQNAMFEEVLIYRSSVASYQFICF